MRKTPPDICSMRWPMPYPCSGASASALRMSKSILSRAIRRSLLSISIAVPIEFDRSIPQTARRGPARRGDRALRQLDLERQLQRELHLTGRERTRRPTECWRAQRAVRVEEIRAVEHVEGLPTELHLHPLVERNVFEDTQVNGRKTRAAEGIAAEIAVRASWNTGCQSR